MNYLNGDYANEAVTDVDRRGGATGPSVRKLGYRFQVVAGRAYTPRVTRDSGDKLLGQPSTSSTAGGRGSTKPRNARLVLRSGATTDTSTALSGGATQNWAPGTTTRDLGHGSAAGGRERIGVRLAIRRPVCPEGRTVRSATRVPSWWGEHLRCDHR